MTESGERTVTEHGTVDLTGVRLEAGHEYQLKIDLTSRGRGYGKSTGCICTEKTGCSEDPSENPCAVCRALDPYEPCPVVGFGAGEEVDR